MNELSPGQTVRVKRMGRDVEAVVIRFDDLTARVTFKKSGKTRTVDRSRIVGERTRASIPQLPSFPAGPSGAELARALARIPQNPSVRELFRGSRFKDPPVRSKKYLAHVRARPCCICQAPAPSDPHHFGPRGMGQKTDDRRTAPLCRRHHDEWHTRGRVEPYNRAETEREFYRAQVDALLAYDLGMG